MNTDIIKANIKVHTIMADVYNNEPHFRPENQEKVRSILQKLNPDGKEKLLDIGCGTGFIIHLAADLFKEIHGVDVTQAMMDKINTSLGNITLHNTPAQNLPFDNNYFDMITAYSFIHHVEDYLPILQEAYRVLKPGGIFYIDLEPNKLFWESMNELECGAQKDELSGIVNKEIQSVLHTDDSVEKQFGIDKETFKTSEYIKNILGGIHPYEFKDESLQVGFSQCEVSFQWFLGQGNVMHQQSFEAAKIIEEYLHEIKPLSNNLFKYLRFILRK